MQLQDIKALIRQALHSAKSEKARVGETEAHSGALQQVSLHF